jgi:hypothetical protein
MDIILLAVVMNANDLEVTGLEVSSSSSRNKLDEDSVDLPAMAI